MRRPPPVMFVTGKGGVGKTTIAAGLATLEAQRHGKSVLVEFGDGESGRRALGSTRRHVEHVVIRPDEALIKGSAPLFGSTMLAKLALGNFAMRPLLKAAPAVREVAMLEAVRQLTVERPGVRVFVDLPATGHSVAWLRVPLQGKQLLGSGPLFDLCDGIAQQILAPGCCSITVVTLAEALVIEETLELCAAIQHEARMSVGCVVVNRVPAAFSSEAQRDASAMAAQEGPLRGAYQALESVIHARREAHASALAALKPLEANGQTRWCVPLAPGDPSSDDVARWLHEEGAS
jgi:arsenite/tail-anchored protein-transporting ATPase